jgi:hypothetical protein
MFTPLFLLAATTTMAASPAAPSHSRVTASASVTVIALETIDLAQLRQGREQNRADRQVSQRQGSLLIDYY